MHSTLLLESRSFAWSSGNSQWCHGSTRLTRADLAGDHLTSLHLRSEILEAALRGEGNVAQARLGLDDTLARLGLHPLLTTSALPNEDGPAWERRAEALWRLGQWPAEGSKHQGNGFHGTLHHALSCLSAAAGSAASELPGAMATVEGPLLELVATTVSRVRLQSPQSLQDAATKLQSIGSIFNCIDALAADASPGSTGRSVAQLAASWHKVGSSETYVQDCLGTCLFQLCSVPPKLQLPSTLNPHPHSIGFIWIHTKPWRLAAGNSYR